MRVAFNDIPGFAVAVKRENDIRDASFLDIPFRVFPDIELRQMTPRDMLILDGVGNPLLRGEMPSPERLAEFLWLQNTRFNQSIVRRFLFGRRARKLDYLTTVERCHVYIDETFQDSPATSGEAGLPYAGWCAHLINRLAAEYGWSEQAILNLPLKRAFQYLKVIRRAKDPESPIHNPSDKVKGDYIRMMNARMKLINLLKRRANN